MVTTFPFVFTHNPTTAEPKSNQQQKKTKKKKQWEWNWIHSDLESDSLLRFNYTRACGSFIKSNQSTPLSGPIFCNQSAWNFINSLLIYSFFTFLLFVCLSFFLFVFFEFLNLILVWTKNNKNQIEIVLNKIK